MNWPLLRLVADALGGVAAGRRLLSFWGPVVDAPAIVGPLLAIASVVMLALLSGIAVASLATLLCVLLALYLLLTEVFGISVDVTLA